MKLILASSSPRRIELLKNLGYLFDVSPADIDETLPEGLSPAESVMLLARSKAEHVLRQNPDAVVIGADTLVFLDGKALGKPRNEKDAARMLRRLSGREHEVLSGVAVLSSERREIFSVRTAVTFYPLEPDQIERYVATGEPLDKAGAYGIQRFGALLVKGIRGDYFSVMGLPLAELSRKLLLFGIRTDGF